MPRRITFSDDTTTGRWNRALVGGRRATIVARAEDQQGFDWLFALKRDYLPEGAEAKSVTILPIIDARPEAMRLVRVAIADYAIVIVDLQKFRDEMLDAIAGHLRPLVPSDIRARAFALEILETNSNAQNFLREIATKESVIGRLETLLSWSRNPFAEPAVAAGLTEYFPTQQVELMERDELGRMDQRQFQVLLARLGAAIGDSLSPTRHTEIIRHMVEEQRFFVPGHFACRALEVDVETDKTFDVGPLPVLLQLKRADDRIWNYVNEGVQRSFATKLERGTLDERVSHVELGLQAADIAASLAARTYETALAENKSGIEAVKATFHRVLFNGRWV